MPTQGRPPGQGWVVKVPAQLDRTNVIAAIKELAPVDRKIRRKGGFSGRILFDGGDDGLDETHLAHRSG